MDVDLSGVESAINNISEPSMDGIENAISNLSPVDADTVERMVFLAVCIVGATMGWRKVLAALAVFIIFEFSNNDTPGKAINLFLSILIAGVARWLFNWVRGKFKKKPVATNGQL